MQCSSGEEKNEFWKTLVSLELITSVLSKHNPLKDLQMNWVQPFVVRQRSTHPRKSSLEESRMTVPDLTTFSWKSHVFPGAHLIRLSAYGTLSDCNSTKITCKFSLIYAIHWNWSAWCLWTVPVYLEWLGKWSRLKLGFWVGELCMFATTKFR